MDCFKVEYLVAIKKQGSFCGNVEAFNNILKADSQIAVNDKTLSYNQIAVDYEVQVSELKEQRFFHLKFNYNLLRGRHES